MVLEIENIKQKLREDAIQERQQFKKSHEDSIHEARLKYDQQLQSLHKSYSATETDCLTLRKEVETLSSRIFIKKSELHELKGQLNEEMKSLQLLDIGTSKSMTEDVNHLLFDYETTLEGNLEKKKEELRGWIQELKDSLERERERKEQEERNFHQQMRERKLEMTVSVV